MRQPSGRWSLGRFEAGLGWAIFGIMQAGGRVRGLGERGVVTGTGRGCEALTIWR